MFRHSPSSPCLGVSFAITLLCVSGPSLASASDGRDDATTPADASVIESRADARRSRREARRASIEESDAGWTEGQVGLGWAFIDFAGAPAHQRHAEDYGLNHGQALSLSAFRHLKAVPRLALGGSMRLSLTGTSGSLGDRYFNPMSLGAAVMYGFLSPRFGPFARVDVGVGATTRKLRREDADGVDVQHDFGIGWSAAVGAGYRFALPRRLHIDILATYERQGVRVERSGAPSSNWQYGISSINVVFGF